MPVATIWLQNFNQITESVKMRGINAQKAHYKCILLLPVKYLSWSGSNFEAIKNPVFMRALAISKGKLIAK